ncbi:MAG: peptide chain release factor N(5)-glutamine methyltransferase, partial [Actinobacteria bacterium]|nr:peptide chain release factor N(5)-glutamine methyltransferase [Actinomycetota bacterium]
ENASNEALWIMEYVLGCPRHVLYTDAQCTVTIEEYTRVMALCARRIRREPLQYLLGSQEFCGLEFQVGPDVLIPRPETEVLIQEILRHCEADKALTIADIGTGSGCLAVTLASRLCGATVYATDLSASALDIARQNARRHGVEERLTFLHGDLLQPLIGLGLQGTLAAIVSNPPYITENDLGELQPEVAWFEPRMALAGGADGLAVYRGLIPMAAPYLAPGGWLMMEVGQGQAPAVAAMLADTGHYNLIEITRDAAGIERVVSARKHQAIIR